MNMLGSFHVWKKASGGFGNADELLKFCAAGGCKGLFSDTFTLPSEALRIIGEENIAEPAKWPREYQALYENWYVSPVICSVCGNIEIRENLPDTYGFNMPSQRIAKRMSEFFSDLGGLTDVYLVRTKENKVFHNCLLYTSPSPRDQRGSRMPSPA